MVATTSSYDPSFDFESEHTFPSLAPQSQDPPVQVKHMLPKASNSQIITVVLDIPPNQMQANIALGGAIAKVQRNTSTEINVSRAARTGTTTFIIKGSVDNVARARREIASALAVKGTISINVPTSLLPLVIGAKGQTLQRIQGKTGTAIKVPNREERSSSDETCAVQITGDYQGCQLAKKEIENIVMERSAKQTVKMEHIETKWFPLISGVRGERVQTLAKEHGVRISLSEEEECVIVTGDQNSVSSAVSALNQIHKELKAECQTLLFYVPKQQHKFLIGHRGAVLNNIFQETGCFVELSRADDPSEMVSITGPEEKLMAALDIVMEKVSAIKVARLELVALHGTARNPREHSERLLRYLMDSGTVSRIENDTNTHISQHRDRREVEITGKQMADVQQAVDALQKAVLAVEENMVATVQIAGEAVGHVMGKKRQNAHKIREQHQVFIVPPEERLADEPAEILLVYEGSQDPKQVLKKVQQELERISHEAADFASVKLSIPSKHHRFIIGPKGSTLNEILGADPVVVVSTGSSSRQKDKLDADQVLVKGPHEEVERVVKEINRVVEEGKHHEIMSAYTVEFQIAKKWLPHIIGKGGVNVNRLKSRLEVRIDVEEKEENKETCTIKLQGLKRKVDNAKKEILEMVENIADQTKVKLRVPTELHSLIIGPQGKYVRKLEDKHNVRIFFPRGEESNDEDEISILGGRKAVERVRSEIEEYVLYEEERRHQDQVHVPQKYLRHVMGRGGQRINEIKDNTDTRIEVDKPDSENEEENRTVCITIKGTKEGISQAKQAIEEIVKEQASLMTAVVSIDAKYHKFLIGPGGQRIKEIVEDATSGIAEDNSVVPCVVKFPKDKDSKVIVSGNRAAVVRVRTELLRLAEEQSHMVTQTAEIPLTDRPAIIGRNGQTLRELQTKHKVAIDIPRNDTSVTVTGKPEDCEAAIKEMLSMVREIVIISVAKEDHSALMKKRVIRSLRSDYGVIVDHPMPEAQSRIDDVPESESIVWRLKGQKDRVYAAAEWLNGQISPENSQSE